MVKAKYLFLNITTGEVIEKIQEGDSFTHAEKLFRRFLRRTDSLHRGDHYKLVGFWDLGMNWHDDSIFCHASRERVAR